MIKHFQFSFILLFVLSLLSTGCGNINSDGNSGVSVEITPIEEPIETAESNTITGVFLDSPVEGLSYRTTRSANTGKTNPKGEFNCKKNENIEFSIGTLVLGIVECQPLITVRTLYSSAVEYINLGILVLALDENGNPDDGIKLPTSVQNQSAMSGNFLDYADDYFEVVGLTNEIIANSPENTFHGGGLISSVEEVRTHFDATITPLGTYSGTIGNLSVSKLEGFCDYTRQVVATVEASTVTFSGFGAYTEEEITFEIPRTYTSTTGVSDFSGILPLRRQKFEVLNNSAHRIYDEIHFNNSRLDNENFFVEYQAVKVNPDGSYTNLCAGSLSLTKDQPIDDFVKMRKVVKTLPVHIGSMFNIVNASDLGTDIYVATRDLNNGGKAVDFQDCILAEYSSEDTKLKCTAIKDDFRADAEPVAALIISKSQLNPLIPDDLVNMAEELLDRMDRLDELFAY
jgi:hypothetical protein